MFILVYFVQVEQLTTVFSKSFVYASTENIKPAVLLIQDPDATYMVNPELLILVSQE